MVRSLYRLDLIHVLLPSVSEVPWNCVSSVRSEQNVYIWILHGIPLEPPEQVRGGSIIEPRAIGAGYYYPPRVEVLLRAPRRIQHVLSRSTYRWKQPLRTRRSA